MVIFFYLVIFVKSCKVVEQKLFSVNVCLAMWIKKKKEMKNERKQRNV